MAWTVPEDMLAIAQGADPSPSENSDMSTSNPPNSIVKVGKPWSNQGFYLTVYNDFRESIYTLDISYQDKR